MKGEKERQTGVKGSFFSSSSSSLSSLSPSSCLGSQLLFHMLNDEGGMVHCSDVKADVCHNDTVHIPQNHLLKPWRQFHPSRLCLVSSGFDRQLPIRP